MNGKVVTSASEANPRKGYICLESEGSEAHFRNIRIQQLPGSNIGGLRKTERRDVIRGIPFLKDIPVLGVLFSRRDFEERVVEMVAKKDEGYHILYNGLNLRGWKMTPGHEGHWQAKDWVLDYDGKSEAEGDKNLWTEREFGNFTLIVDWRLPGERESADVSVILPDGSEAVEADGKPRTATIKYAGDSGIYLRGSSKSQINIWNWPVGSGEIWGYRTDKSMPAEVRRAATPILNADNPVGQWNRFEITAVGDKVTVVLNGKTVIKEAKLPDMPAKGFISLQHHGDPVQFANIYIKELN